MTTATLPCPVVLTRPSADAAPWQEALTAAGFDTLSLPLIAIEAINSDSGVQRIAHTWAAMPSFTALMFVSANAAQHWCAAGGDHVEAWLAAMQSHGYTGPRCWAPGPGTAAALQGLGVLPQYIDQPAHDAAQFDSEALWAVVQPQVRPGAQVLVVRGCTTDHAAHTSAAAEAPASNPGQGREWLAQQCEAAQARVHYVAAYQRVVPRFTQDTAGVLDAAARVPSTIWLASSAEGLRNLQAVLAAWSGDAALIHAGRLLATHTRIADQARALGWQQVHTSRPAKADVVLALRTLRGW